MKTFLRKHKLGETLSIQKVLRKLFIYKIEMPENKINPYKEI